MRKSDELMFGAVGLLGQYKINGEQELLEIHRSVAENSACSVAPTKTKTGSDIMSVENVKKFYEAVSQDESLKQKFVELSRKYQGQEMDEATARALTVQEVLPLAAQMGYSFSMDDLKTYDVDMKQANINRELSDAELEAVTGGIFACFIIGAGNEGGACVGFGVDSQGQPTCIGLGVTTL